MELYEFGSVADGMLTLLTGAGSFADLVRDVPHDVPEVDGDPVSSERLVIQSEATYGLRRRQSLDVACLVQGQEKPRVIMHLRDLKRIEGELIKDVVRRLAGGDLSLTGESLGQRLLNTRVPLREGLAGDLRAALHRYGTEAVQCAILTGHRQPVTVSEPWRSQLNPAVVYQGLATSADALLPPCRQVEDEFKSEVVSPSGARSRWTSSNPSLAARRPPDLEVCPVVAVVRWCCSTLTAHLVARAENPVRGSDQQSCSPSRPAVMIIDLCPWDGC